MIPPNTKTKLLQRLIHKMEVFAIVINASFSIISKEVAINISNKVKITNNRHTSHSNNKLLKDMIRINKSLGTS